MASLTLLRRSTEYNDTLQSYRMVLEITKAESISKYVFVNQRIKNFQANTFEDVFAAVATPAQLEDFDVNSPSAGTSFFRTSKVDIVSRNLAYLEDVFTSIVLELQKLTDDTAALTLLHTDATYEIAATGSAVVIGSSGIDVLSGMMYTPYRLPLISRPCGTNTVFTEDGEDFHIVGSQNTSLLGWLNTTITDPAGYKFKYNIATDTSLSALWPPAVDKLDFAHIELNGVSIATPEILINTDGIYWKPNGLGNAPWAQNYVSLSNVGSDPYLKTIVLDFII